jgi:hypothetical protein
MTASLLLNNGNLLLLFLGLAFARVGHPFASAISALIIQASGGSELPPRSSATHGARSPSGHPQTMPPTPTPNQGLTPGVSPPRPFSSNCCSRGSAPRATSPLPRPRGLDTSVLPPSWLQQSCKNDLRHGFSNCGTRTTTGTPTTVYWYAALIKESKYKKG